MKNIILAVIFGIMPSLALADGHSNGHPILTPMEPGAMNGTKLTWVGYKGEPNHALIRAIVTAQAWVEEIKAGQSVSDIMQAQKIPEGMIWKRIRLAFLSPKILKAIVDGTANRELSIKMLTKHDLPRDWSEQEALFLS